MISNATLIQGYYLEGRSPKWLAEKEPDGRGCLQVNPARATRLTVLYRTSDQKRLIMNNETNWDLIIQRHLDGLTSEDEAKILSARIIEDEEIRSLYLKAAQLHGALSDETMLLDVESETTTAPS